MNTNLDLSQIGGSEMKALRTAVGLTIALSAHTPRVQPSVYNVGASWRSQLGWETSSSHLASGGIRVDYF